MSCWARLFAGLIDEQIKYLRAPHRHYGGKTPYRMEFLHPQETDYERWLLVVKNNRPGRNSQSSSSIWI